MGHGLQKFFDSIDWIPIYGPQLGPVHQTHMGFGNINGTHTMIRKLSDGSYAFMCEASEFEHRITP